MYDKDLEIQKKAEYRFEKLQKMDEIVSEVPALKQQVVVSYDHMKPPMVKK